MKFKELPSKWRAAVILLSVSAILLLTALIAYVYSTIGSLLHVMIG